MSVIKFRNDGTSDWQEVTAIKGNDGKDGDSGVYSGETIPDDSTALVWIDTDGEEVIFTKSITVGETYYSMDENGNIDLGDYVGEAGEDGVTFTPSVSSEGVISWTNDGGLTNPTSVNIKGADGTSGTDGQDGADGLTTAISLEGTTYNQVNGTIALPNFPMVASQIALARLGCGYGVCDTAANVAAKTVSISGFTLVTGGFVVVRFTNANTVVNPTLNINGTGAKSIYIHSEQSIGGMIAAEDIICLVYDGASYHILALDRIAAALWVPPAFEYSSWATIKMMAERGDAADYWNIGDTKNVTLSTGETITVRIEDFRHDTLPDGGKAGITFSMVDCLADKESMNTADTNVNGWSASAMRTYMSTLKAKLPTDLQSVVKTVNKYTAKGNRMTSLQTTEDDLWLFSYTELGFDSLSYGGGGAVEGEEYPLYIDNNSRKKNINGVATSWWLRTPFKDNSTDFCIVWTEGTCGSMGADELRGVCVGFCV